MSVNGPGEDSTDAKSGDGQQWVTVTSFSHLYLQQLIVVHTMGKKTVRPGQFPKTSAYFNIVILSYIVLLSFNIVLAIASLLFVIM